MPDKFPIQPETLPTKTEFLPMKSDKSPMESDKSPMESDKFPIGMDILPITTEKFPRGTIIKASGAIASEGKLGLVERRLYNLLLAVAYDKIDTQEIHTISLDALKDGLGDKFLHLADIATALENLVSTVVRYNIFEKDKRHWVITSFLSGATIREELHDVAYSFSPELRVLLSVPPYAKLSVERQKTIGSKHSLVLYELLNDYYDAKRGAGETQFMLISELQALFGTEYESHDFRRYVIEKSLETLASSLEFSVKVAPKKRGRKITHFKFLMKRHTVTEIKIPAPKPSPPPQKDVQTFATLSVGTYYKIAGGDGAVFVKLDSTTARKETSKKVITIQNIHAEIVKL